MFKLETRAEITDNSSRVADAKVKASRAFVICEMMPCTEGVPASPPVMEACTIEDVIHRVNMPNDSATAWRVGGWFVSKNDHTDFHTLLNSTAHADESATWYANMASPRTRVQDGEMMLSDFGGGASRTPFMTARICSAALAVPVVEDAVNKSERIE